MKICNICNNKKPTTEFYKHKTSKDGRQSKCKKCDSNSHKKYLKDNPNYSSNYWEENREVMDKQKIEWLEENREYANEYQRKYRKENLEKVREYQNVWVKNKYKNDINYRLKQIVRGRINFSLKELKKTDKTITYLGCHIKDYRVFLEKKFKPEMNWKNYGEIWEIDHILPLSKGGSFHYTNTQPLFKTTRIAEELGYKKEIGNRNKGWK